MADDLRMASDEALHTAHGGGDLDSLLEEMGVSARALTELDVTRHLGAACVGQRTGDRERPWDARVGTIVHVPRVRDRSSFPALLEPRRRAERALLAVQPEIVAAPDHRAPPAVA